MAGEGGLPINIIQVDNEQAQGQLIAADASFFVFSNSYDESVQVIPRSEVDMLETNIGVNLFQLLKAADPGALTDRIELEDGSVIPCIILDVTPTSIQYFTGDSLKRHMLSTDAIYMLHMDSDSVQIPFPMLASASPSI